MFAGLISPRAGLGIIRSQLEKELNAHWKFIEKEKYSFREVSDFMLVIDNTTKEIYFVVSSVRYPYNEGETLCKTINVMVENKIPGKAIERIALHYSKDSATLTAGYIDEQGQKLKKTIVI